MNSQDDLRPRYPINRRTFVSMVAAGAASTLIQGNAAAAQSAPKARNVVLVHGLFADGSSWSEVIARLQAAGLNATAVQNPLTTLPVRFRGDSVAKLFWSRLRGFVLALAVRWSRSRCGSCAIY